MNKKFIPIITGLAFALVLTGCTSGTPEVIKEIEKSDVNPNHITTDDSILSLLSTPALDAMPVWSTQLELPAGWVVNPNLADEFDGQGKELPPTFPYLLLNNTDTGCNLVGDVTYLDSYKQGRGDLYLSKEFIYQILEMNTELEDGTEGLVNIAFGDKEIQFVTGNYTSVLEVPNISPEGEDLGGTKEVAMGGFNAVRAFDMLVDRPDPVPNRFGTDSDKGIPAITVNYTCMNVEDGSAEEFNSLLAALVLKKA